MKKYLLLTIALFFAALNFNLILKPLKLVTGGTQGLALILNNIFKISPIIFIFLINIIMLILSFVFLSRETTFGTVYASLVYPLLVKMTAFIHFNINNYLLFSLIAGIVCGITGGVIYKLNFSSGGLSTLNVLVSKYTKIRIAVINFVINTILIVIGIFLFGLKKALYALIVIFVSSIIIDLIVKKGFNKKKD